MLSAASKVYQLDLNFAALSHPAMSHHDILWLQVPVTPVLMQLSQSLHATVHTRSALISGSWQSANVGCLVCLVFAI